MGNAQAFGRVGHGAAGAEAFWFLGDTPKSRAIIMGEAGLTGDFSPVGGQIPEPPVSVGADWVREWALLALEGAVRALPLRHFP